VTVLVFSRDIMIVIICTLLYATGAMRVFAPSWWGKANTVAQIVTVPLVMLREISKTQWISLATRIGIWATVVLTIFSGVHYAMRVAFELRSANTKAADHG
jgi:cardiolipin synthase